MSALTDLRARQRALADRVQARLSARMPPARGFVTQPEPRTIGTPARGRQLIAGNFMFVGHLIEAPGTLPWDLQVSEPAFVAALHDFGWLDDLAALGDMQARMLAQHWLWAWIDRYGRGHGPGWTPEIAGRRTIRWLHHALMLLRGTDAAQADRLFQALAAQTRFLSRRAGSAPPGQPRIEALSAQLYAALALEGLERFAEPARRALLTECARSVAPDGAIPSRSPEELLEVFALLSWAQAALRESRFGTDDTIAQTLARIAPVLRALRHADGALARFHGGGRGAPGRLDAALAEARLKRRSAAPAQPMGYVRLARARTTLIVDAAPPPDAALSGQAHASTLAFELTSGRRPLIVNCGAGGSFGAEWRRAGRATPSHSTLCLAGASSARLTPSTTGGPEWLSGAPRQVPVQLGGGDDGPRVEGGHDGYVAAFGLTHARCLQLSGDGRTLTGEDYLVALDTPAKVRFDAALDASRLAGVAFRVHFHLHPDVDATLDLGGAAVSLVLRSGEVWVLRFDGPAEIALTASAYLERGRLRPRACEQVVLSGRATGYTTRLRWSLAKAQDTGLAVRDLVADAEAEAEETEDAL